MPAREAAAPPAHPAPEAKATRPGREPSAPAAAETPPAGPRKKPEAAKPAPAVAPVAQDRARLAYDAGQKKLLAGDSAGAIEAYREALRLSPWSTGSIRGLGLAYEAQGDRPKAISAFEQYLRFAPHAADAPTIQARVEALKGRR